jgi:uncharacterized protein (DUF1800 family)
MRATAFRRARRNSRSGRRDGELRRFRRLDSGGTFFLLLLTALGLAFLFTISAPGASADRDSKNSVSGNSAPVLDKKFKGDLPITELTEDQAIAHALNRLAYGPRPGDVERIRQMGLAKWIDVQLDPDSINDSALDKRLEKYPTLKMSSKQLVETYPQANQAAKKEGLTKQEYQDEMKEKRQDAMAQMMNSSDGNSDRGEQQFAKVQGPNRIIAELSMAKLDRAVYSDRQLEAVMEDFWFNHFNVFANKGADKWLLTSYVRDTIRPHTMGKFDDLLIATAKSPAMLFFLDNWLSADPAAVAQKQREMAMRRQRYQGVFGGGFPPQPGTFPGPATSAPGAPPQQGQQKKQERGLNENYGREVMELHTVGVDAGYTQTDVTQMAEILTGWTVREPRKNPDFFFDDRIHAQGKKTVMGRTFDYGGMKDGEEALKMLANDPHTARFISTELARHFVSDNPPKPLVDRMVKDYEATGGNIRSLLKVMIYSPEFWSTETYRNKVKTPFELVASAARVLDANVSVSYPLVQWVTRMGEPLFLCQPPTGYSDKAETWVNTGALLNRMNFALGFASDHVAGSNVDLNTMFGDAAAKDPQMALSRALQSFLDDQVSPETRETIESRLNDPQILQAALDDPVKHVNEGLISGLVLGAPEFQRR